MNNQVRLALISLVSVVWAVNMLAPIFVKGYEPQEGVHVAFMAVVGVLTAGYNKEKKEEGE